MFFEIKKHQELTNDENDSSVRSLEPTETSELQIAR